MILSFESCRIIVYVIYISVINPENLPALSLDPISNMFIGLDLINSYKMIFASDTLSI